MLQRTTTSQGPPLLYHLGIAGGSITTTPSCFLLSSFPPLLLYSAVHNNSYY